MCAYLSRMHERVCVCVCVCVHERHICSWNISVSVAAVISPPALAFSPVHLLVCNSPERGGCVPERGVRFSTNVPATVIWWLFTTSAANWEPNCFRGVHCGGLLNLIWGGERRGLGDYSRRETCACVCVARTLVRALPQKSHGVCTKQYSPAFSNESADSVKCPSGAKSEGEIFEKGISQFDFHLLRNYPTSRCVSFMFLPRGGIKRQRGGGRPLISHREESVWKTHWNKHITKNVHISWITGKLSKNLRFKDSFAVNQL